MLGSLINIVGGKVFAYEGVLDRARREALLRMKESAPMADMIVNTRLEMVEMQSVIRQMPIRPLCLYAYGTAIHLKEHAKAMEEPSNAQARVLQKIIQRHQRYAEPS